MLEVIVGGAVVAGVIIQAADFWLRWFRKPPASGHR
jgi:hypothetical protein